MSSKVPVTGVRNIFPVKRKIRADPRFEEGFEEAHGFGPGERWHGILELSLDAHELPGGDNKRQVGAFGEQLAEPLVAAHSSIIEEVRGFIKLKPGENNLTSD